MCFDANGLLSNTDIAPEEPTRFNEVNGARFHLRGRPYGEADGRMRYSLPGGRQLQGGLAIMGCNAVRLPSVLSAAVLILAAQTTGGAQTTSSAPPRARPPRSARLYVFHCG